MKYSVIELKAGYIPQNWILLHSQDLIHQKVLKIRLVALMIELHRNLAILKKKLEVIEIDPAEKL